MSNLIELIRQNRCTCKFINNQNYNADWSDKELLKNIVEIFPYPYNFTILKKLYFHNYVKEHNQSLYSIYKLNIPISSGSKIYHDKHKTKNV